MTSKSTAFTMAAEKVASADHHEEAATAVDPGTLLDGIDQQATPLLVVSAAVIPQIDDEACRPQAVEFAQTGCSAFRARFSYPRKFT